MRIVTLFGISIRLSPLFVLLLTLMYFVELLPVAIILFATVLVHEGAHIVAARNHGLRVGEIELLPFGGVARIDDLLEVDPLVEESVAWAGPLVNVFLAALGWGAFNYGIASSELTRFFVEINLILGGFNLIPALPLDGGRIYRARVARSVGYRQATERATRLSKGIAIVMFLVGVGGLVVGALSYTAIALSIFIFLTADKEQNMSMFVLMRYLTRKREELQDRGWMEVEQLVAHPDAPIKDIVWRFVPKRYHVVWTIDDHGMVLGVTSETALLDALFESGIETPMSEVITGTTYGPCHSGDGDN